jgi:predicted ester cyclase
MAADNRIRGQEVTILISQDDELRDEISEISKFSFIDMLEIISRAYLGQKSEKKDTIFKGVKGSMDVDMSSVRLLQFADAVKKKAKRETPDVVFTITAVLSFPDGTSANVIFRNLAFGEIPTDVAGRAEYVKTSFSFECEDTELQFS